MWTPFGRMMRDLRTARQMKLKDMAEALGISSAYASAIETGRKNATVSYVEQVTNLFDLEPEAAAELGRNANESRTNVTMNLTQAVGGQRDVANAFARKFATLTDDEVKAIMKILED